MVVLACEDLSTTVQFFQGLGFRIDMITPADNPRNAILSMCGLNLHLEVKSARDCSTIRLQCGPEPSNCALVPGTTLEAPNGTRIEIVAAKNESVVLPPLVESLQVLHLGGDAAWAVGRAGMQYRDLIPCRLGGRVIASHIHIPEGGLVPDYVHFHRIVFQMIYCKSGWVRVVYEDQGDAFVLEAGDCVLQPPEIRHRVLECSDNLEVIEIGLPAEHETCPDHDMALPSVTGSCPGRLFGGQAFAHHVAKDSPWQPWRYPGFVARNTGIDGATSGLASVLTIQGEAGASIHESHHQHELLFLFVLCGAATLSVPSAQVETQLETGSSVAVPSLMDFKIVVTVDNTQLLVAELPAPTVASS